MSDRDEWGPWIEHDGKGCPVPVGTHVLVYTKLDGVLFAVSGMTRIGCDSYRAHGAENLPGYSQWVWGDEGAGYFGVIRYRIRKPRGLTILENAMREVEREGVDA